MKRRILVDLSHIRDSFIFHHLKYITAMGFNTFSITTRSLRYGR